MSKTTPNGGRGGSRPSPFLALIAISAIVTAVVSVGVVAHGDASTSFPTPVFSDNFESGTLGAWNGNTGTGSATLTAAAAHSGGFGLHLANASGQFDVILKSLTSAVQDSSTSFWVKVEAPGAGIQSLAQARDQSSSSPKWGLLYDPGRQGLWFYPYDSTGHSTEIFTGANSAPLNTWFQVEVRYTATTTGGAALLVNGNSQPGWSVSGNYSTPAPYQRLQLWDDVANATDFDDVAINAGGAAPTPSPSPSPSASPTPTGTPAPTPTPTPSAGPTPTPTAPPTATPTPAPTSNPYQTALFADGFESGGLSNWNGNLGTGSATVTAASAHSGSDGLHLTNQSGQFDVLLKTLSASVTDSSTSFWVKVESPGAGVQNLAQARDQSSSSSKWGLLYDAGQKALWFYPFNGAGKSTEIFTGANTAPLNTWFQVEVRYTSTTTGGATLFINGATQAGWSASGDYSTTAPYQRLQLWDDVANATDIDDVAVKTSGSGPTPTPTPSASPAPTPTSTSTTAPTPTPTSAPTATPAPTPTPTPGGCIPSGNAIQQENCLPGDTSWGDFASVLDPTAISGYGSTISVNHGGSIDLFTTTTAASLSINVYRMGWYNGAGGRFVESLGSFPGVNQPQAAPDPSLGTVVEHWSKTTTLQVPSSWVTGVYLAKLTSSAGNSSFIFFVVRDDAGHEPYLFKTSVATYEAYNRYGGTSLYNNDTNGSVYSAPHAMIVSFDRPFNPGDSNGAGHFLWYEYPMLRWMEKSGYDVAYTTDVDVDMGSAPLTNHKALLSVGHDEYWSLPERTNVVSAIAHGTNAGFFSGNTMYWQVRYQPSAAGVPDRLEVGYKDYSYCPGFACPPGQDPDVGVNNAAVTNLWRADPVDSPENAVAGEMYAGQTYNQDYVVQNASSWVYAGTGFTNGQHVPGIVGYEFDQLVSNGAGPAGQTILAQETVPNWDKNQQPDTAQSSIYTAPGGARVFAAGTIQWSYGLDNYGGTTYVNAGIQRATANLLANFAS